MAETRNRLTGRLLFGFGVITLGVLFTLDNLGLLDAGAVLHWWPVLPLAYGLARFTGYCCRQSTVVGAIFTLGGAFLLLDSLGMLHFEVWDFWPLVLVLIGGSMVMGALRRTRGGGSPGPEGDASARINTFTLWSGIERKVASQEFRGGDITAIMGGQEIDLRGAKLAGGTATIDLLVVWGGVDLRVPEDWRVSVEALPLMGGIEDSSKVPAGEARGHLVLKGLVLMGGVDVKN